MDGLILFCTFSCLDIHALS